MNFSTLKKILLRLYIQYVNKFNTRFVYLMNSKKTLTYEREVSHIGYKGPIMLYPRQFLDNFFGGGLNESTSGKQLLKG